jgi:hypothetical protein
VRGGLFRKAFMFNPHKTCYTCLGLIFRYEFNGGARFGIGLTKKGNLLVLYVFCTVFQSKFNRDGHYICVIAYLGRHLCVTCIRLVIHVWDSFFDMNSMVVPVLESD